MARGAEDRAPTQSESHYEDEDLTKFNGPNLANT